MKIKHIPAIGIVQTRKQYESAQEWLSKFQKHLEELRKKPPPHSWLIDITRDAVASQIEDLEEQIKEFEENNRL